MRRTQSTQNQIDSEAALATWRQSALPQSHAIEASCTLLTPMYGGGVEPGEVDCALPIRPSGIRGQLRFWWRLLHGAGMQPSAMFEKEKALWGGIGSEGATASLVTLQVQCEPVKQEQLVLAKAKSNGIPDYGLILESDCNPRLLKAGFPFKLAMRFAPGASGQQRQEVVETLRWWASFGGVGARTRRGFGAVKAQHKELKPVAEGEVRKVGGCMVVGAAAQDAVAVWHGAMDALKDFRQGAGTGRSQWPEADAIRRATGKQAHRPKHEAGDVYPRAAFGLPIVFHFKDRGDPPDRSLQPVVDGDGKERMASPLILRPYFNGKVFQPMALLLPDWKDRVGISVALHPHPQEPKPAWPESPSERKRLAQRIEPMREHGTDALSAFMQFFEQRTAKQTKRTPKR